MFAGCCRIGRSLTIIGTVRRIVFGASVALFACSLFLPAFSTSPGQTGSLGIMDLMAGWMGLIAAGDSPANLAWLANAAVVAAWGFGQTRMRWPAIIASLIAIGLAALPAVVRQVAVDEAGTPRQITGFGLGYFAWCGAMVTALAASCLLASKRSV